MTGMETPGGEFYVLKTGAGFCCRLLRDRIEQLKQQSGLVKREPSYVPFDGTQTL
ncbi:hypothetical protein [Leptolyngbya sp. PL-A3]|uniref:hypothetical protein n=1 Tax=Leptolyngbya sp. PL-A3 TaxID=2933911 RepID=UPI0032967FE3